MSCACLGERGRVAVCMGSHRHHLLMAPYAPKPAWTWPLGHTATYHDDQQNKEQGYHSLCEQLLDCCLCLLQRFLCCCRQGCASVSPGLLVKGLVDCCYQRPWPVLALLC